MEDNEEEEDDDNYHMFPEYGDTATGEVEDQQAPDEPADDLGRVIVDAHSNCESEKERLKLERMLEDYNKFLYPNCEDDQKKLGTTLELLQWKAQNGLTDKGFEILLKILKNMLPRDNVLPHSTYEAKKIVCPLGLDVKRYMHASMTTSYTAVRNTRISICR